MKIINTCTHDKRNLKYLVKKENKKNNTKRKKRYEHRLEQELYVKKNEVLIRFIA